MQSQPESQAGRKACSHCGYVHYRNPAPAVSVLIAENGKVLIGKRSGEPGIGTWAIPSGYIEYDEDFLSAARREAREETGLNVEIQAILHVTSSFVSPRFHFLGIYVSARVVNGILAAGDDLESVTWHPLCDPLPPMGFEEDREIIQRYAHGYIGIPVEGAG